MIFLHYLADLAWTLVCSGQPSCVQVRAERAAVGTCESAQQRTASDSVSDLFWQVGVRNCVSTPTVYLTGHMHTGTKKTKKIMKEAKKKKRKKPRKMY